MTMAESLKAQSKTAVFAASNGRISRVHPTQWRPKPTIFEGAFNSQGRKGMESFGIYSKHWDACACMQSDSEFTAQTK
jgi:hypothetical protein